jgi:hypothetical protein
MTVRELTNPTEAGIKAAEAVIAEWIGDKADGYWSGCAEEALMAAREVAVPEGMVHDG